MPGFGLINAKNGYGTKRCVEKAAFEIMVFGA
jgi:hypothetical protein